MPRKTRISTANRLRKSEIKRRGGSCQKKGCNSKRKLEFSHTKKTPLTGSGPGRGSYTRIKDVIDHKSSYRLRCDNHHK